MSPDCSVAHCDHPRIAKGLCNRHYKRAKMYGDPTAPRPSLAAENVEDIEWMVETGECLTGAARRLGVKTSSLEKYLERHGRRDLYRALRSRERVVA